MVGSGPAGLMAAHVVATAGHRVRVFERRPSAGRKLLIAGASGLNLAPDLPLPEVMAHYAAPTGRMDDILRAFPPERWLRFVHELGIPTFRGTSRRHFVEGMKAAPLVSAWRASLEHHGVEFHFGQEMVGFTSSPEAVELSFADGTRVQDTAAVLCLGGASWEKPGTVRWPDAMRAAGVAMVDFTASNVGYEVAWPPAFLAEAEGQPLKNVVLESPRGRRAGDLVITRDGLEGTPIYFVGCAGSVHLDLKPDLTVPQILRKLQAPRENLSPLRRARRCLNLCPAALSRCCSISPLASRSGTSAAWPRCSSTSPWSSRPPARSRKPSRRQAGWIGANWTSTSCSGSIQASSWPER